jgi:hypothetical protein
VADAVRALLDGPTDPERVKGLTTGLPDVPVAVQAEVGGPAVTVTLSGTPVEPEEQALRQLACTVSAVFPHPAATVTRPPDATAGGAVPAGGAGEPAFVDLTVAGQGWSSHVPADDCPPRGTLAPPAPTSPVPVD